MHLFNLRRTILLSFCLAGCSVAFAATKENPPPPPVAELSVSDAIVLGIVEGVTEFLPISSTGHLIIANQILGLDSEKPLTNKEGEPLWYRQPSPKHPEGVRLTLKLAADTYAVVIQAGAIAAVVLLYWHSLLNMALGLIGRSSSGARLFRNIMLAFVPVAIIGLLTHDLIDKYLFSTNAVVVALVAGAILMLWAERWRRKNSGLGFSRNDPADLAPGKALGIGLAQCLALFPGTSRSMMTIIGGYLAGLSPAKAAEFSFLVGLPTLAGAAIFKGWKSGGAMIEVFGWPQVLLGGMVAALSAAIAVKFLVSFLTRNGLAVFAYYRLFLAFCLVLFSQL